MCLMCVVVLLDTYQRSMYVYMYLYLLSSTIFYALLNYYELLVVMAKNYMLLRLVCYFTEAFQKF